MALETMVLQQDQSSKGYYFYNNLGLMGQDWSYGGGTTSMYNSYYSSPEACSTGDGGLFTGMLTAGDFPGTISSRRKRKRTRYIKNKDEVENQRMAHINVERNRRKQMNEYLAILRSLMPSSYVQRGDQASIVGGAINFVKELEQLVQSLEAHKHHANNNNNNAPHFTSSSSSLFSDFFTFPQYSTSSSAQHIGSSAMATYSTQPEMKRSAAAAVADVEVSMTESHANIKVLAKRQPRQLLKLVASLHSLHLTVLHLNIATANQMVLYSISVKAEENCQLTSMNDIAAAVHELMKRIQDEAAAFQ